MSAANRVKMVPGLYLVSTPIGTIRDITLKALDYFQSCDVLVAEDTRSLRRLLELHDIALEGRRVLSYHDHSSQRDREMILKALSEEKAVVYASEAGTPLISDPGYQLVREIRDAGLPVFSAPGPSALLAALVVAGLPTDQFYFAGFAPQKKGQCEKFLQGLSQVPATLVFYESAKRLERFLTLASEAFGEERNCVVARELTKKFEQVLAGTVESVLDEISAKPVKGEIVVLFDRAAPKIWTDKEIIHALVEELKGNSKSDAVKSVTEISGAPKKEVYRLALTLKEEDD